jgi:hypothetical protein
MFSSVQFSSTTRVAMEAWSGEECVRPDESFARPVKFHRVCRQFRAAAAAAEIKGKKALLPCCRARSAFCVFSNKQRKREQAKMKEREGEFPPETRPPGSKFLFR